LFRRSKKWLTKSVQRSREQREDGSKETKREKRHEITRKSRRRQWIERSVVTVVLILLAGAGSFGLYNWWTTEPPSEFVPSLGNLHVPSPEYPHAPYNSDPPTSGPHLPYLASWGVHSEPIPRELQVHNLEDGGVVIQYNCLRVQDCNALQQQLEKIVRDYDHVVLAPYPAMGTPIALTAWTRIRKLDRVDEKTIRKFIEAYIHIDHHPQSQFPQ
jgi:Protein of unknown function (DUF3105)